jgi:hypothetical protein
VVHKSDKHVHMYGYNIMSILIHATHNTHARARAHTHTHTHTRARAHTHHSMHTHTHTHTHALAHKHTHAHTHTHTHTCICSRFAMQHDSAWPAAAAPPPRVALSRLTQVCDHVSICLSIYLSTSLSIPLYLSVASGA